MCHAELRERFNDFNEAAAHAGLLGEFCRRRISRRARNAGAA
jgi:hypothetical protein